ncbi:MAG: polyketide synthase, partial [Microcystis aeruginosa]
MNSSSNLNNLVQNWLVKQLADQLSLDAKTINVT